MSNDLALDEFIDTFYQEASENVASLEASLMAIDATPDDDELMNAAFRAAHSLKGGSGLFGLTEISRFTHALETLLDQLRSRKLPWSRDYANLLLSSVDVIRDLLAPGAPALSADGELLRAQLLALGEPSSADSNPSAPTHAGAPIDAVDALVHDTFSIRFRPLPELFARGTDPVLTLRELSTVANVVGATVDTSMLPALETMDPTKSYFAWDFLVTCEGGLPELREVFDFVEGYAEVKIEKLSPAVSEPAPAPIAATAEERMRSVMVPGFVPTIHELDAKLLPRSTESEPAPKRMSVSPSMTPGGGTTAGAEASTVRIATKKLDRILDLVGEVVIAKAMVAQALLGSPMLPNAREALTTLERHTRELQEGVMSARMVPISTVFGRFHRVVRELGTKLGKDVVLSLEGMETEIDKAMVEQLVDPLTHLVRNAIDHGLETPETRLAAGKSHHGTVKLSATQRGATMVIEIQDDGQGLALDRVRAKAIESGLIAEGAEMTPDQLHMLVFAPGFSTAAQVSDVSGRGVGMDVVKRNVEALGGSLVFTSRRGEGSLIRLQLPLTMAIIDGLLLRVGSSTFVVPLLSVVESFRPTQAQLSTVLGRGRVLQFRGAPIPLVVLGEALSVSDACDDPTRGIVVVVESGDEAVGLLVDELVADAQVVVKSLEVNYRRVDGLSGAAVMGDGRIALILDVGALVRRSRAKAESRPFARESSLLHP